MKKKESGAEGRKRRKIDAEESEKASKFMKTFFVRLRESNSPDFKKSPNATSLLGSKNDTQSKEEIISEAEQQGYDDHHLKIKKKGGDLFKEEDDNLNDKHLSIDKEKDIAKQKEVIPVLPKAIKEHDIGLLKFDTGTGKPVISDSLRLQILKLGSVYFKKSEGLFLPKNNRSMNVSWFKRKLGNGCGEEIARSWLLYSPHKNSAFCLCCLLFFKADNRSKLEQQSDFSNWKAPERISVHENSKKHCECFTQWKEMEKNLNQNENIIDAELQLQIERESLKWRDILTRILRCTKYLATQNLALRGHRESLQLGSEANEGNFLNLIKLLSIFDPVLKEHLFYVENHPGCASYLSPRVQNEFIHLMASAVRNNLLKRIRKAKYYGLLFDSTPDQAHRE
ncbi:hypothetical protein AVEN_145418-1 [Araneus ventricosus]|uniref:TTF-type domain-containing protein n=1 Tax=Araneus ventricosus TaxID=182803 RepID=A0A4Y2H7W5_ARAVE|nr:hypothetical protein AVEN_145418-1 [Araneus ventricosus]